MRAFSTVDYDLDGDILILSPLSDDDDIDSMGRRVQRDPTLDGDAVLVDSGYAVADRTIKIAMKNLTLEKISNIKRLFRNYSAFIVITDEGAFKAVASDFKVKGNVTIITFLVSGDA